MVRSFNACAKALGAIAHYQVDAKDEYFARVLKFLVMGNIRRGHVYPLCVGAERVLQAQLVAEYAKRLGTTTVAHGCTAAGNDQVRFDVAIGALAPDLKVLTPAREWGMSREETIAYGERCGIPSPVSKKSPYSIDLNLLGRSIEAGPLEDPNVEPPEEIYALTVGIDAAPDQPQVVEIGRASCRERV